MAVLGRLRHPLPRLMGSTSSRISRSYGSAAAAQLDYYYDDEEELRSTAEESVGCVGGRGVQWVIMGSPMVRRHLYAERLSKLLEVPHISMGSLVRQELHPSSSLYKQIASAVNQRKLVPEDIIFSLLSKRLEEGYNRGESGFILDGIPRTRVQAEILNQIVDVDLVVNLKCTEECLIKKDVVSGVYTPSQEFLSRDSAGLNFGIQLQGGQLKSPSANIDGIWREKHREYTEQCKQLEEYYRKQKKLLDFQVVGAPRETWQGLLAALHLQHMNAQGPSHKLTV